MSKSLSWRILSNQLLSLLIAVRLVIFVTDIPTAVAANQETPGNPYVGVVNEPYSPDQFVSLTNAARQEYNLPPLALNQQLSQAARAKAYDMAARGYWEHFRPGDGKTPWDFIKEQGYAYQSAGENLARGFQTPAGITRAWLASPSHLANIISPRYSDVGFADVRVLTADGQSLLLTVQMFGSR